MQLTALNSTDADLNPNVNDLGPLAWVLDELRKSLDGAAKALKRFVRDAEVARGSDLSAIDASQLRIARQQLHQAVGALEMVGLAQPALLLRAMEAAVQRFVQHPEHCSQEAAAKIERASFALTEYLEAVLAGRLISAVSLFPQYRDVQELVRADRIHPADLWPCEWRWLEPVLKSTEAPRPYDNSARATLDHSVLQIMKGQTSDAAKQLRDLSLGFSTAQVDRQPRIFWKIAAAYFEAFAHGLISVDIYTKRAASRVLIQYASLSRGDNSVSDRLAQDLLFFCSQAVAARASDTPILSAVRAAYSLARFKPVDYEAVQFGRFDPALLAQARKRIVSAKETWSSLSAGDLNKFKLIVDQFSLVADSLIKLHPPSEPLAQALSQAVDMTARSGQPPAIELAMEVATAVLYLEAAFEDLDPNDPQLADRTAHLARRLEGARAGGEPQPLESWMEELYRRVSDKQTMGSVVGELRISLGDIEKSLDSFFRNPVNKTTLRDVPSQLSQMRGVLSVLGLDQAARAVSHMRDSVGKMLTAEANEPQTRAGNTFDQLGNNLGALSFLIDMLNYQPALAKKLFVYDDDKGELRPLMGRTHKPDDADTVTTYDDSEPEQASSVIQGASTDTFTERLTPALDTPQIHTSLIDPSEPVEPVETAQHVQAAVTESDSEANAGGMTNPAGSVVAPVAEPLDTNLAVDFEEDELLDIFLEEAREVAGHAQEALRGLTSTPADIGHFTVLRRAFHTLKGSSRMVGLTTFGDAAWSMEQLLNSLLAEQKPATDAFLHLTADALSGFSKWIDDIAAHQDATWSAAPFCASADAMRTEGRLVPLHLSAPSDLSALSAEPVDQPVPMQVLDVVSLEPPISAETAVTEPAMLVELTEIPTPSQDVSPNLIASEATDTIDFDLFFADELPVALPPELTVSEAVMGGADSSEEVLNIDFDSLSAVSGLQNVADAKAETLVPVTFDVTELETVLDNAAADTPLALSLEPEPEPEPALQIQHGLKTQPVLEPAVQEDNIDELVLSAADFDAQFSMTAQPQITEPSDATVSVAELLLVESLAEDLPAEAPKRVVEEPRFEAATEIETQNRSPANVNPDEQVRVIGTLRIGIPLYNVYLNEADEWSRRLVTEVSEWAIEHQHPIADSTVALAHSLAGSSATVGFDALSDIARAFENALQKSQAHHSNTAAAANASLFVDAAEDIRRLLHQFAAGFLKQPDAELLEQLRTLEFVDVVSVSSMDDEDLDFLSRDASSSEEVSFALIREPTDTPKAQALQDEATSTPSLPEPVVVEEVKVDVISARPTEQPVALTSISSFAPSLEDSFADDKDDDIDAVDAIDAELFPIFDEEAAELMPQLGGALRQWSIRPDNQSARNEVLRILHTLKGSARLAGALRLGEMAHNIESEIEFLGSEALASQDFESLLTRFDSMEHTLEVLRKADTSNLLAANTPETAQIAPPPEVSLVTLPVQAIVHPEISDLTVSSATDRPADPVAAVVPPVVVASSGQVMIPAPQTLAKQPLRQAASASVRVRSQLLDRLVNQAGEVMISRSRLEVELGQLRSSLGDMSDNLNRLRQQLHDIELQAETQMQSRLAQAKELQAGFDPLEFDRFTRLQELTRMMAESVNDVATVQRTLQRTVEATEDDLVAQARQTRELQRDLLRTRMVEFEGISDRLYRVVRLASKETGKQVRLDLLGGTIEMDRGLLDRMTPAFEHLLRNCVAHGIESPQARVAAGKDPIGLITVHLRQEGNDVSVDFSDDGAGLDLKRIREKALMLGLVEAGQTIDDQQAAGMIFMPGFSTAAQVTELSGRGIGMDVVRSEINAVGGRIETATVAGQGTHFKLVLPLTTAVTQVVMVRAGNLSVGVPASVVETVRRATAKELQQAYNSGSLDVAGEQVPFFWSGALLQSSHNTSEVQTKTTPVVIFRSAAQRIALHVDEVLGNQEVVVKNLGPQLSRLPGLAGMSVLASGAVILIYNPVALATIYGEQARALSADRAEPHMLESADNRVSKQTSQTSLVPAAPKIPLIMVVDDSITVRRVTQRLLQREGYRVVMAADGLQALERLQEELPTVVLSDIEMPRMDGFDLARNIRSDPRLSDLPIVMITSRIAGKHREHAKELGVDHYLGKPYSEDELMSLVRHYCSLETAAV
ncbi:MAG: response regulator [Polaromonas sp.]|nr:MAG: response regulator [Polaromonas sp.]